MLFCIWFSIIRNLTPVRVFFWLPGLFCCLGFSDGFCGCLVGGGGERCCSLLFKRRRGPRPYSKSEHAPAQTVKKHTRPARMLWRFMSAPPPAQTIKKTTSHPNSVVWARGEVCESCQCSHMSNTPMHDVHMLKVLVWTQ